MNRIRLPEFGHRGFIAIIVVATVLVSLSAAYINRHAHRQVPASAPVVKQEKSEGSL